MTTTERPGLLDDGRSTWQTTYRVRFDEAGPDGVLRTSGFMRYAQDLAWQHSADLGFGRAWYAERGLTWLVRAAELVITAAPEMGSTITARTAIVGIRRVFARRRGEFRLADGTPAGWVHTDWVLIDARGALTRIPSIFPEAFGGTEVMGAVGRIPLPPTSREAVHRRFAVRPHELDPMDHANNAVYLDWLEEAILDAAGDRDGRAAARDLPRRYRMEFALAVEAGAELDGAAWRDDDGWSYRLAGADGGADRFRARMATGPAAVAAAANDTEEAS
ncbi:MAG TPA: acyl-ACP thioesterase domain-containing protein [Candidatus Limnocylindrales bacterium]|nr:acyl-ACP thioesterase domain-containing protein [Candidatus Limnocylindrales bacterium]